MKYNPNGSIKAASVANNQRVVIGNANYTLDANLEIAKRKVRVGQVAVLPSGSEWLRQRGCFTLVQ